MKNELEKNELERIIAENAALKAENAALKEKSKPREKKASYNQLLLDALRAIANKNDKGELLHLKAFIDNMASEKSKPDKWNYCAFIWQAFNALSIDEFKILKALSTDKKSALYAFPSIGTIWGKKIEDAISAESR